MTNFLDFSALAYNADGSLKEDIVVLREELETLEKLQKEAFEVVVQILHAETKWKNASPKMLESAKGLTRFLIARFMNRAMGRIPEEHKVREHICKIESIVEKDNHDHWKRLLYAPIIKARAEFFRFVVEEELKCE